MSLLFSQKQILPSSSRPTVLTIFIIATLIVPLFNIVQIHDFFPELVRSSLVTNQQQQLRQTVLRRNKVRMSRVFQQLLSDCQRLFIQLLGF